jgi:hypothetical protein
LAKEDRELASLRSQPEPVFTTKGIDVALKLFTGHCITVYPPKTRPSGSSTGACHDTSLVLRNDCDPSPVITENHYLSVLPQKVNILSEGWGR